MKNFERPAGILTYHEKMCIGPGGHLVRPACSLLLFVLNAFQIETVIVPCFNLRSGFESTVHIVCGL